MALTPRVASFLMAAGLLSLVLAGPTPAEGLGLGPGDRAVDFEGKDFVNTDPLTLRELRGRLVLLELFSTT